MKPWIGRLLIATLIVGGLTCLSVPVMAGDSTAPLTVQEREARRQEWLRLKWERLMAQAKAQQDTIRRWQDARIRQMRAHRHAVAARHQQRLAAQLDDRP